MPPSISDSLSSSDAIVREGANVSLTCHVDGYPKPDIKWKRDDGLQININKTLTGTTDVIKGIVRRTHAIMSIFIPRALYRVRGYLRGF